MASLAKRATSTNALTHEGGGGFQESPLKTLKRLTMTCLLWEDTFYQKGSIIAQQMRDLIKVCKPLDVAALAIEAREKMFLRHVPLFLVRELAKVKGNGTLVANTLPQIIQRPDEISEYVNIYWAEKKQPLSAGSKRGLAKAFLKFNAFQLAKYQDQDKAVKLSSVLRMVRPKALTPEQNEAFKHLRHATFPPIETWETLLSAGKDKKETFEKLLREKKLGGLALLRNLRNMQEAKVDETLIRTALGEKLNKVWPYRFIAAAKYAPNLEDALEVGMFKAAEEIAKLPGKTGLLVDVSGSMADTMSRKSDLTRLDAACGLAILLREKAEHVRVATFNDSLHQVPNRRGFALRDAIGRANGSTCLADALRKLRALWGDVDRLIIITDEQSHDGGYAAWTDHAYVINVASYQVGVSANKGWTLINGWSERVFDYILMEEQATGS